MRVFVSSTVFDLIDVRAEIASQLRSMGIVPVMSDDKLSDFRVEPHEDSIETCLVNLDSCDEVILILDRRYGPRLGKAGFDDISATHLEYRRASEMQKPIHVFVRDRTEAEHGIWKKNKETPVVLNWVDEKDTGIFKVLDEHKRLQAQSKKSNWCDTFTSSIDLKAAIAKRFDERILPQRLVDAIQRNEFPIVDVKVDVDFVKVSDRNCSATYNFTINNVGGSPAFDFRVSGDRGTMIEARILASGGECQTMCVVGKDSLNQHITVEYRSPLGVSVSSRYLVSSAMLNDSALATKVKRIEHTFRRSPNVQIEICDE